MGALFTLPVFTGRVEKKMFFLNTVREHGSCKPAFNQWFLQLVGKDRVHIAIKLRDSAKHSLDAQIDQSMKELSQVVVILQMLNNNDRNIETHRGTNRPGLTW